MRPGVEPYRATRTTLMFFTRPEIPYEVGDPRRARHCKCPHPWGSDDGCVKCGHLWERVIEVTWALHGPPKAKPHQRVPALTAVRTNGQGRRLAPSPELAGVAL